MQEHKYHGVSKSHDKWRARIKINGSEIHLGTFEDKNAASEAFRKAEIKYFGFNRRPKGCPNRIKIFSNRAMIYLNGNTNKASIVSVNDVENLRKYYWSIGTKGYAIAPNHKKMHRIVIGAKKSEIVDHINHNKLDNRRFNLRITDNSFNIFHTPRRDDVGLTWDEKRSRWVAQIGHKGRKIYLGSFKEKQAAIDARYNAEIKLFGVPMPRKEGQK